jgi:hypothetical protein
MSHYNENSNLSNSSTMLAEEYAEIVMNEQDPAFYGKTPTSIYYCTYIIQNKDGSIERKKLSTNALSLYTFMRCISGERNICWMNTESLAEAIGRSTGAVSAAKKELTMPMEQLGGKSLITIKNKNKVHKDGNGATKYHVITINFIWPEHNAYMRLKSRFEKPKLGIVYNLEAPSNIESETPSPSNIESASPRALSNIERNNRTVKENTLLTEHKDTSVSITCNFSNEISVIGSVNEPKLQDKKVENPQELHQRMKIHAEEQMRQFGCDEPMIKEMLKKYSPQKIIDAGVYTDQQGRHKRIENKQAYLRKAIEKGLCWKFKKIK